MVSHEIPEIFGISDYVAMLLDRVIVEMATAEEFQRTRHPAVREFIAVGPRPEVATSGESRRPGTHA